MWYAGQRRAALLRGQAGGQRGCCQRGVFSCGRDRRTVITGNQKSGYSFMERETEEGKAERPMSMKKSELRS